MTPATKYPAFPDQLLYGPASKVCRAFAQLVQEHHKGGIPEDLGMVLLEAVEALVQLSSILADQQSETLMLAVQEMLVSINQINWPDPDTL